MFRSPSARLLAAALLLALGLALLGARPPRAAAQAAPAAAACGANAASGVAFTPPDPCLRALAAFPPQAQPTLCRVLGGYPPGLVGVGLRGLGYTPPDPCAT